MPRTLHVDAYFDLICPWCLIGRRHLQQALQWLAEIAPEVQASVRWHGVRLVPNVPPGGRPFAEFYARRLGSPEAVRQRQADVMAAAQAAGVRIDFTRIQRFPDTARAHQLLACTAANDAQRADALMERLFSAYFERGEDIGDPHMLRRIAQELGIETGAQAPWLAAEPAMPSPEVAMPSVPFFVFNHQHTISGAQPAQVLLHAMQLALAKPAEQMNGDAPLLARKK